jgi:hypothetical protein
LLHTTENLDAALFNNLAQHFERPLSKAKMDGIMHATEHGCDEDILRYYPLEKTQQKRAKWPSCSQAATV